MKINGKTVEKPQGLTISKLLQDEGFDINRVAVLLNEKVVKKASFCETCVKNDDTIEVVSFVGGG